MKVESLIDIIGSDFYVGVPDSQLKALCNYLIANFGISDKHVIAANEGNAVGLAAGYHLATGKIPVVYMQNSGEGNIVNPVCSLMNEKVYGIPCIFIIGWRGEPGVHDEPQHIFQGEITIKLLDDMNIASFVISKNTADDEIRKKMTEWMPLLKEGKQVAFIVRKGAVSYGGNVHYSNENKLLREDIIKKIVDYTNDDLIVSTTGKASRELFEIRVGRNEGHERDFLTVGSMGHSSSIALGIALQRPDKRVWIIDGDGALLMHMGSMAVLGATNPNNVVHVVINNGAHETVGGMPTVASKIDVVSIAKACGYKNAESVDCMEDLESALKKATNTRELTLIEVKCAIGARDDLGRPTTTAKENKENFMRFVKSI